MENGTKVQLVDSGDLAVVVNSAMDGKMLSVRFENGATKYVPASKVEPVTSVALSASTYDADPKVNSIMDGAVDAGRLQAAKMRLEHEILDIQDEIKDLQDRLEAAKKERKALDKVIPSVLGRARQVARMRISVQAAIAEVKTRLGDFAKKS